MWQLVNGTILIINVAKSLEVLYCMVTSSCGAVGREELPINSRVDDSIPGVLDQDTDSLGP